MPTWGWVIVCGLVGVTGFYAGRHGFPVVLRTQAKGARSIDPVIDPKVAIAAKLVSKAQGSPAKV
jgi:hypothetical protein